MRSCTSSGRRKRAILITTTNDGTPSPASPSTGTRPIPSTKTLSLVIDSTAGTALNRYSGAPADSDFLRDEIQNLVHYIRQPADVAVIGVGGGTDVLSALEFDQRSVTGIEINGDIVDIVNGRYGDFTGHLDRRPARRHRERRSPQLPDADGSAVRHHPGVADRYVGGDLLRRVRAQRERSVHDARLEHVPRPARAGRRPLGDALLPNDGSRGEGGAAARDVPHGRVGREGPHRARRRGSRATTSWCIGCRPATASISRPCS